MARIALRTDAHLDSAGMLLVKLGRAALREFTDALEPTQLKPRYLAALHELRNGPMSQQALGDALGADASKLVGLLNYLETEGLASRRRAPTDRRRHIVELSEHGRARLAAAEGAVGEVEDRLLAGLDDEERAQLHGLLRQIAENTGLERCEEIAEAGIRGESDCG